MSDSLYKPIKELGQNFLTDTQTVNKMVEALELTPTDIVIEIGPGLGVLTEVIEQYLTSTESRLIAVEIDERFTLKLDQMFLENANVEIVKANVLDWLPTYKDPKPFKLIGSLPYYITSPIVHKIVQMESQPEIAVLLVQKEVADRINNKAPDATYLSSYVQTFFEVSYLGKVDRKVFSPEPEVDGGILKLVKKQPLVSRDRLGKYEGFLHKGFSNPRKMLNKVFTAEELAKVGIDATLRAQNLDVDKWVQLFNITS
ncbi:MAG TPA: 16S rRNA (adenine(1518)-N(6)/adenine(1519)-N(6))-dimethyltransferase RsmA [Candidatus Saccharimonadales bacterium]|nr:16S rRNA (adenine(1518)-N(6)/adenine(1519)-N(6))-dimethyltransferase RsmA [Candidatus Saccharimonadales bacterium]